MDQQNLLYTLVGVEIGTHTLGGKKGWNYIIFNICMYLFISLDAVSSFLHFALCFWKLIFRDFNQWVPWHSGWVGLN